ncbi:MAG: trigger factor [Verrucomicrobiae bacterium]|nr:trigger factor [Verrucomicrobiae bacterium]
MNVSVEHLGPCKKLVRVEVSPDEIQETKKTIVDDLVRRAQLPGFRAGKAPRSVVVNAFRDRITSELKSKLVADSYRKAIKQQNLRPIGKVDVEEGPLEEDKPFTFTVTLETEPDFELPDYRNLPIRADTRTVTEEDVMQALESLRAQCAKFVDCNRPVENGLFVVVNYTGTVDGKPITELAPTARGLAEKKNFWLRVAEDEFIPGFTTQLLGATAGSRRVVNVSFPADFVVPELRNRSATYDVEILQVKEKVLPPMGDELAKEYGAPNFEALKAGVRRDLELQLAADKKKRVRDQLITTLLGRVNCELPEGYVMEETRNVIYDIVRANQERGVPKEAIDQRKDEIYSVASNSARERVKAMIVLRRIAEQEKIEASPVEVQQRILQLAKRYGVKPEKFAQQLYERNAIGYIVREIVEEKVLDTLELYARVEEPPAPTL